MAASDYLLLLLLLNIQSPISPVKWAGFIILTENDTLAMFEVFKRN
jgi:hypothetical protein